MTFEILVPKSIKLLLLVTLGHRGVFGPSHPRFAHFCLPSFRGHLGVVLTLVSGNCKVTRPPAVQMRQALPWPQQLAVCTSGAKPLPEHWGAGWTRDVFAAYRGVRRTQHTKLNYRRDMSRCNTWLVTQQAVYLAAVQVSEAYAHY